MSAPGIRFLRQAMRACNPGLNATFEVLSFGAVIALVVLGLGIIVGMLVAPLNWCLASVTVR